MLKKSSKLCIPNDPGYIKGVISYCNEISRRVGFSTREVDEIGTALKEACTNVVTHAFDPYEDESFTITFEILSDGMKIVLDEMGLPFSFRLEQKAKDSPGLHAIEENMDKVLYINRGKNGKELQLIKYLKGRHVEDLFTEDELKPYDFCDIPSKDIKFCVRLMRPEEATNVSRCIYRTYKYTYLNEDLYFPERIDAMNRDGSMISSVAVTMEGEVIAHFALLPKPNGKVAEIGVAVVDPKFRGRGVMQLLLNYLISEAKKSGFIALFGNAFTMHTLSQRTNLKFGFQETALQLGGFPPGSIQPIREKALKGAGHVISFFKYIKEPEVYKVFLPSGHKDMLEGIYRKLGIKRSFSSPDKLPAGPLPEESIIQLSIKPFHKTATIEVKENGADIEKRVKAKLVELENKGFNALYLDLNLKDPSTVEATRRLEELGFFFSGLLPDYSDGDVLRLQYYNTVVDYDEIETYSPFALELMNYIRSLDPKWRALHS
jgi:anti-sigma regulatory factor (Ser/Thr protein kinase)/GNAT superfamily N-acetyltransferase